MHMNFFRNFGGVNKLQQNAKDIHIFFTFMFHDAEPVGSAD